MGMKAIGGCLMLNGIANFFIGMHLNSPLVASVACITGLIGAVIFIDGPGHEDRA